MQLLKQLTSRKIFFLITILCGASVAYAFYAEFVQRIDPCPLCIAQRVILIVITILAFIYALHNPQNIVSRIYGLVLTTLALINIKLASHHLWLMNLPADQQPMSCGMPLEMLYQRVPLKSFLHTVLQGDAECGKINWTIVGLTPPVAVIILSSIVALLALFVVFKKKK